MFRRKCYGKKSIKSYSNSYVRNISNFFVVLVVAIILVATVAVYLQVYKRHINKALQTRSTLQTKMVPPYKVAIVLTIVVLIIGLVISYFVGYKAAYDSFEDASQQASNMNIQTFYAEVKEISNNTLSVEGISLNEESYRGEFNYDIWEGTNIMWHDTPISLNVLNEGNLVSVTLVTANGGITDVYEIRLLEDERGE